MGSKPMYRYSVAAAMLAGTFLCASASAQTYPSKPIRIIVPFPPGGNSDITARTLAPGLTEELGQQVVIDNRSGASGTVGAELAAKSAPDGYTLLLGTPGTLITAQALYPKLRYDPVKDFATTSLVSTVPMVMIVHPSVPARNVKEFIALSKSRPGRITMAFPGVGTSNHLGGALFQSATGTKLLHIQYKGSGPALIDLIGGQVDVSFEQLSSAIGYIQSGKLRALAVTSLQRAAAMPELPTLAESGVPGFDANTFTGIVLPAATPRDIVTRLHAALVKVLRMKATRESFARFGAEALESTPEEFARFMRDDIAKWSKVVREAGIKLE